MKVFKKLKIWFWTKKRIIDEVLKMQYHQDFVSDILVRELEILDQNKVYVCNVGNLNFYDIENVERSFKNAGAKMKWTMPKIFFVNKEIRLMTKEELKLINIKKK